MKATWDGAIFTERTNDIEGACTISCLVQLLLLRSMFAFQFNVWIQFGTQLQWTAFHS